MKKVLARAALALLVAGFALMPDAHSQQKRRPSRRTTTRTRPQPVQAPDLPDEPAVVSTADDAQPTTPRRTTSRTRQQQQHSLDFPAPNQGAELYGSTSYSYA